MVEAVLTFLYVFVILAVTRRASNAAVAGLGLSLTLVHLIGIPIDGTFRELEIERRQEPVTDRTGRRAPKARHGVAMTRMKRARALPVFAYA